MISGVQQLFLVPEFWYIKSGPLLELPIYVLGFSGTVFGGPDVAKREDGENGQHFL